MNERSKIKWWAIVPFNFKISWQGDILKTSSVIFHSLQMKGCLPSLETINQKIWKRKLNWQNVSCNSSLLHSVWLIRDFVFDFSTGNLFIFPKFKYWCLLDISSFFEIKSGETILSQTLHYNFCSNGCRYFNLTVSE